MKIYKSSRKFYLFLGLLALISLGLLSNQSTANSVANYALDIISPQPNLDIKNRWYKAYPNLEYNVRLGVTGGAYPFSYELTTAPTGMTIDDRGEITWANPMESATQYNVTAKVTDAHSVTRDVSWPITVTKNGFRFLDANNGTSAAQGGTGTFANPWKSMIDMYEGNDFASKRYDSYAGEFLYWRNGTYAMEGYTETTKPRVPFVEDKKPLVWLAYPGEKPVIDMADAYISIYSGGSNTYFDGLEFNANGNARGMGIVINSSASNVTFRRNKLHGITDVGSSNNAMIFIARENQGSNYMIQDNEFYDVSGGYGLLGYTAKDVLVENNVLHDIATHPISPKQSTQKWFIRGNRFYDNSFNSIVVQYADAYGIESGDIEISYNLVETGGGKVRINTEQSSTGSPVHIFRNTFLDDVDMLKVTSTNGEFNFYNNVIVNETPYPDKIRQLFFEDSSNFIVTDNLTGSASDNIVDANGNLTASFIQYLGSRGYQLAPESTAMSADFDNSGLVDGDDLTIWEASFGVNAGADADQDGDSDGNDLLIWQQQFSDAAQFAAATQVPEPASWLLCVGFLVMARFQRKRGAPTLARRSF